MAADLLADTAVHAIEQGKYTAELDAAWNFKTPLGGVLMSVAINAMRAELADPELSVLSASCTFCSAVPEGPVVVQVEILRRGRTAAQISARLSSGEGSAVGLIVVATFARERQGPDIRDIEPPDVPGPEACEGLFTSPDDPESAQRIRPAFSENFDVRLAEGHRWWERDWEAGPARMARWVRYLEAPTTDTGLLDALAIPPVVDVMPAAVWEGTGPGFTRWIAPSLDLTVHFLEPTAGPWLLIRGHCRRAWDGYATATMDVFDESKRLVAFSTQTMLIKSFGNRRR